MKKVVFIISLMFLMTISVYALGGFSLKSSEFSFASGNNKNNIDNNFSKEYSLTKSLDNSNSSLEKEIIDLSKKTTYLLIGEFGKRNESSEHFYRRYNDYLALRYNPKVPKDSSSVLGLDTNSQEYKDDVISGVSVPGMFTKINELEIVYNSFGDIVVVPGNNGIMISKVILPSVMLKTDDDEDPSKYKTIKTNLILYYMFKKLDNEYKLYYLMAETKENIDNYINGVASLEDKSRGLVSSYSSELSSIYNFDKLKAMKKSDFDSIYNKNINSLVSLNGFYNNTVVTSGNGFFINDGLIVTTWSFLESSLKEAQFISVNGTKSSYVLDGVVTINPDTDIALLKVKNKNNSYVTLGNKKNLKTEDPAIMISSKSGVNFSTSTGIVISNSKYIQSSIPVSVSDIGSPLFDKDGSVVGININKSLDSSISFAVGSDILKEIQDKFKNINFDKIKTVTFDKLKQDYYVNSTTEKIYNNIPKNKWREYSKIGNIEDAIKLKLVKASYKDGIVSLRYKNTLKGYIDNEELIKPFKTSLKENGYKEILNTSKKSIYQNKKYKVIIMDEVNYLVIVMVKK